MSVPYSPVQSGTMPALVCPKCGYDSKGLPSALCPECGQSLPPVSAPAVPALRWRLCLAGSMVALTAAVAYTTTVLPGVPRWWGPLPLTVVIPYFILGGLHALIPMTVSASLLFLPVALGCVRIPWWSAVPMLVAIALAWFHLTLRYADGLRSQGMAYVATCALMESAFCGALVVLLAMSTRRRFWIVVFWHFLAAIWLASYAFPYYGELP